MATIVLHRHEVEDRALPFVCIRCGREAHLWKTKTFLLASPSPAANVGKLNRIEVPLCASHKAHWFWRGIFGVGAGLVLVALFGSGLAAVSEPDSVPQNLRGVLMVGFGVGFLGLLLWLPVVLVLHFTSVRPTRITEDDVTLAGVSQEFIDQLKEERRASPERRKASRRAGRRRQDDFDE